MNPVRSPRRASQISIVVEVAFGKRVLLKDIQSKGHQVHDRFILAKHDAKVFHRELIERLPAEAVNRGDQVGIVVRIGPEFSIELFKRGHVRGDY